MRITQFIVCFFIIFSNEVVVELLVLNDHEITLSETSTEEGESEEKESNEKESEKEVTEFETTAFKQFDDHLLINAYNLHSFISTSIMEIHSPPPELI